MSSKSKKRALRARRRADARHAARDVAHGIVEPIGSHPSVAVVVGSRAERRIVEVGAWLNVHAPSGVPQYAVIRPEDRGEPTLPGAYLVSRDPNVPHAELGATRTLDGREWHDPHGAYHGHSGVAIRTASGLSLDVSGHEIRANFARNAHSALRDLKNAESYREDTRREVERFPKNPPMSLEITKLRVVTRRENTYWNQRESAESLTALVEQHPLDAVENAQGPGLSPKGGGYTDGDPRDRVSALTQDLSGAHAKRADILLGASGSLRLMAQSAEDARTSVDRAMYARLIFERLFRGIAGAMLQAGKT